MHAMFAHQKFRMFLLNNLKPRSLANSLRCLLDQTFQLAQMLHGSKRIETIHEYLSTIRMYMYTQWQTHLARLSLPVSPGGCASGCTSSCLVSGDNKRSSDSSRSSCNRRESVITKRSSFICGHALEAALCEIAAE